MRPIAPGSPEGNAIAVSALRKLADQVARRAKVTMVDTDSDDYINPSESNSNRDQYQ